MRLKLALALASSALALAACQNTTTSPQQAQPTPSNNAAANKALVMQYCEMTQQACECFANQLQQALTPQQWVILQAALTQASTPPEGTTPQDIQILNEQLILAVQGCSDQP